LIDPLLAGREYSAACTSATVTTTGKRLLWRTDATSVSHGSSIPSTCR
jgi:hypothetical protein